MKYDVLANFGYIWKLQNKIYKKEDHINIIYIVTKVSKECDKYEYLKIKLIMSVIDMSLLFGSNQLNKRYLAKNPTQILLPIFL